MAVEVAVVVVVVVVVAVKDEVREKRVKQVMVMRN